MGRPRAGLAGDNGDEPTDLDTRRWVSEEAERSSSDEACDSNPFELSERKISFDDGRLDRLRTSSSNSGCAEPLTVGSDAALSALVLLLESFLSRGRASNDMERSTPPLVKLLSPGGEGMPSPCRRKAGAEFVSRSCTSARSSSSLAYCVARETSPLCRGQRKAYKTSREEGSKLLKDARPCHRAKVRS